MKHPQVQAALRTNPEFPSLNHLFPMLINWSQVKRYLIAPRRALLLSSASAPASAPTEPMPATVPHVLLQPVLATLSLPFHRQLTDDSTLNTLRYLFFHMRCGIYVMVRGGLVQMFVPFANARYVNTWSGSGTSVSGGVSGGGRLMQALDVGAYYRQKRADTGYETEGRGVLRDKARWWANGNMVCNEPPQNVWGDHLLCQIKDMLDATCARHAVPDVEFFVNKRDFPQLRKNYCEPYDFMFDERDRPVPVGGERFDSLAPIFSFYVGAPFADLALPCSEDWEGATGRVFLRAANELFTPENRARFDVPWGAKIETAFFRGSATGAGVTPETNQRLHLALLSHQWAATAAVASTPPQLPLLDAGITGWNARDKKQFGAPMAYIRPSTLPFKKAAYVPIYEQARFKYLVYVQGHCAANRYAFLMSIGCVILKVTSSVEASEMWYFPLLQPYVDHVPVAADLSDLEQQIRWCRAHDQECRAIAAEAQRLHRTHLSVSGICAYMHATLTEISKRQQEVEVEEQEPDEPKDPWFTYAPLDSGIPPPLFTPPLPPLPTMAGAKRCRRQ